MAEGAALLLPPTPITTAVTGLTSPVITGLINIDQIIVEGVFTWGSGGTTAKVWLQTSLDNGLSWFDIASLAFTTASAAKVSVLSANIAPASQAFTPGDGVLTDNTIVQGVLGDRLRAKYTTTGTYAGGTTLAVWVACRRRGV